MARSQRPAVAVLLIECAHAVERIQRQHGITLDATPRVFYRVLLDVLAKREKAGITEDEATVRETFAELVPLDAR